MQAFSVVFSLFTLYAQQDEQKQVALSMLYTDSCGRLLSGDIREILPVRISLTILKQYGTLISYLWLIL